MKLSEAAESGDYRKTLESLRDRLARELEDASAREVAPLAKQLQDVLATLDRLPSEREVTLEDELDRQRQKRVAQ